MFIFITNLTVYNIFLCLQQILAFYNILEPVFILIKKIMVM